LDITKIRQEGYRKYGYDMSSPLPPHSNIAPAANPPSIAKQEPINALDGYSNLADPEVPVVADGVGVDENTVATVPIFVYGARVFDDSTSPLTQGQRKGRKRRRKGEKSKFGCQLRNSQDNWKARLTGSPN